MQTSLAMSQVIGSPGLPRSPERVRAQAEETFDRGVSARGTVRQMMAVIVTQTDRGPQLREVAGAGRRHARDGRQDGARLGRAGATAAAIPGAELVVIDGHGPRPSQELYDTFTRRCGAPPTGRPETRPRTTTRRDLPRRVEVLLRWGGVRCRVSR